MVNKNLKYILMIGFGILFASVIVNYSNSITAVTPGTPELLYDPTFVVNDTSIVKYAPVIENNYVMTLKTNWSTEADTILIDEYYVATDSFTDGTFGNYERSAENWNMPVIDNPAQTPTHTETMRLLSNISTGFDAWGTDAIWRDIDNGDSTFWNVSFWMMRSSVTQSYWMFHFYYDDTYYCNFGNWKNYATFRNFGTYDVTNNIGANCWYYIDLSFDFNAGTFTYFIQEWAGYIVCQGTITGLNGMPNIDKLGIAASDTSGISATYYHYFDAIDTSDDSAYYWRRNYDLAQFYGYDEGKRNILMVGETTDFPWTDYRKYSVAQYLMKVSDQNQTLVHRVSWQIEYFYVNLTAMISNTSIHFILTQINSSGTYIDYGDFCVTAKEYIQIDITICRVKLSDADYSVHRCYVKIIQDYTNISILPPFRPFWKMQQTGSGTVIKQINATYGVLPDANHNLNNSLLKVRFLIDIDLLHDEVYIGFIDLGYIEGVIPDYVPTTPIPPNPEDDDDRTYWDLYTWNLTFDSLEHLEFVAGYINVSFDYPHSVIESVKSKYYYEDFRGKSTDWGDWGIAFNWLRDGLHYILSSIWIGVQYIGCLLANFVTYCLGYLLCGLVFILWDVLIYWLVWAVVWAAVNFANWFITDFITWFAQDALPVLIDAIIWVFSFLITLIVYVFTFGQGDIMVIFTNVSNMINLLADQFTGMIVEFFGIFPVVLGFIAEYAFICIFTYLKELWCKGRGFVQRARQLEMIRNALLSPLKLFIDLAKALRSIII